MRAPSVPLLPFQYDQQSRAQKLCVLVCMMVLVCYFLVSFLLAAQRMEDVKEQLERDKDKDKWALPTEAEQKELAQLWLKAIIRVKFPTGKKTFQSAYFQAKDFSKFKEDKNLPVPALFHNGAWYSITAWNPMGKTQPLATNIEANKRLRKELYALQASLILRSTGTDDTNTWREDGYCVQFLSNTAKEQTANEDRILALGRKYGQAALYRHEMVEGKLMQTVLPTRRELEAVQTTTVAIRIPPPFQWKDDEQEEDSD